MSEIPIVVTVDCERAAGPLKAGIWIRAYADIAAEFRFPVTFLRHPEVAVAQADPFRELESNG